MQIVGWDELSEDQRAQVALVDWSDWNAPSVSGLLHDRWLHGRAYQEYTSLVAVEGRRVLARVGTVRVSFRDRSHSERVVGVGDVITNPRDLRRGLATRLMNEAHGRARAAGIELAFLGTRVSWAAHRAYEKLGYRDVYSSPRMLRWVPRLPPAPLRPGFTARRGRRTDGAALQRVLEQATVGRIGLLPRTEGWFEARIRWHWNRANDYLLLRHRGSPVGYAMLSAGFRQVICNEAVTQEPAFGAILLDAIERRAVGRWLAFSTTTFLRDHRREFLRRGYLELDRSHTVLMACGLGAAPRAGVRRARSAFRDPRLFFQQHDSI